MIDRCSDARPFPTGIALCASSSRIDSSEEDESLVFFAGRSSILALVVSGMVIVVMGDKYIIWLSGGNVRSGRFYVREMQQQQPWINDHCKDITISDIRSAWNWDYVWMVELWMYRLLF